MPVRKASAVWEGDLKSGRGRMKIAGRHPHEASYTAASRFEEGSGSNPEELIGAAHAGCFSMAFSNILAKAGHTPKSISTTAKVHIDKVGDGFKITTIELDTEGDVPGIDAATFEKHANDAKENCPVSQALKGVDIRVKANLK